MREIVTDIELLREACAPVASILEGDSVARELIEILDQQQDAIGIAANQVGINKKVCIVRVDKTLTFINPEIVSTDGEIFFQEGCLSFPNETVVTKRFCSISVKADNYKEIQHFIPDNYLTLLESVCIQHEIDHLNGIVMQDRKKKA